MEVPDIQESSHASEQEPQFNIQVETVDQQELVMISIQLPRVVKAGDIEAEIVSSQIFELTVPGLYALRTTLPRPIDDEQMSCRFDKKKKVLSVKVPVSDRH